MFYEAVFSPEHPEQLAEEVRSYIGKKIVLQAGGRLDNGPKKGEQCFLTTQKIGYPIPASDLKDVKSVSYLRWQTMRKEMENAAETK